MSEPDNNIGNKGARALADGVKGLKGLEYLNLAGECAIWCWSSHRINNGTHAYITQVVSGLLCGGRVRMLMSVDENVYKDGFWYGCVCLCLLAFIKRNEAHQVFYFVVRLRSVDNHVHTRTHTRINLSRITYP